MGCLVGKNGIKPDPQKVAGIKDIEAPRNVADMRRHLGIANHLARFIPNLLDSSAPLRQLLQKGREWTWGPPQEEALVKIKDLIYSNRCMAKYDPKCPTILSADVSAFGLGAVLLQKQDNGERRPVAFASRSLTSAESRYAQIQKEALALTWAADRFEGYLRGLEV